MRHTDRTYKHRYIGLRLGVLFAIAGVLLLIEASSSSAPSSASDADLHAILQVSQRGEALLADGGSKSTYFPASWHGGRVTSEIAAQVHQRLAADLGAVFSTELAARYLSQIEAQLAKAEQFDPNTPEPNTMSAADLDAGKAEYPIVRLAGRVNSMTVQQLTSDGQSAHLVAVVDASAEVAQVRDGHEYVAHPRATIVVTDDLQKTPAGWRIIARTWTFAPGSEP